LFHINRIVSVDFLVIKEVVVHNLGFFLALFGGCQLGRMFLTPLCPPILKPNLPLFEKCKMK
jgi:hypothetical protein